MEEGPKSGSKLHLVVCPEMRSLSPTHSLHLLSKCEILRTLGKRVDTGPPLLVFTQETCQQRTDQFTSWL